MIYEANIIPEWVPMEELSRYGEGTNMGIRGLIDSIKEDIMRLFNREKKHIRVIRCYSRREMERMHDKFVEKGIMAEESIFLPTARLYRNM